MPTAPGVLMGGTARRHARRPYRTRHKYGLRCSVAGSACADHVPDGRRFTTCGVGLSGGRVRRSVCGGQRLALLSVFLGAVPPSQADASVMGWPKRPICLAMCLPDSHLPRTAGRPASSCLSRWGVLPSGQPTHFGCERLHHSIWERPRGTAAQYSNAIDFDKASLPSNAQIRAQTSLIDHALAPHVAKNALAEAVPL